MDGICFGESCEYFFEGIGCGFYILNRNPADIEPCLLSDIDEMVDEFFEEV